MRFAELIFETSCIDELNIFEPQSIVGDGVRTKHFFPNGYGVSVIRFEGSCGYEDGLYEVAILKGTKDNCTITYEAPPVNYVAGVIGYLDEQGVENILTRVESFPLVNLTEESA